MVRYTIALSGWLLLACSADVHAQLNNGELPTGLIQRNQAGQLKATVRLGAIPFGKTEKVQFRLTNDTNAAIELGPGKARSGYATLKLETESLLIGESTTIEVEINVHGRVSSEYKILRATIDSRNGSNIVVSCHYTVSGLLAFSKDRFMAEVSNKSAAKPTHIHIPFIATAPVNITNVRVEGLGALSDTQCEVLVANGKPLVRVKLDRDSFPDTGLAGEIEIRDQVSGAAAQLPCFLYTVGEFEIGPQHLSFAWSQTRNCYESNAIFRLLEYEQPDLSTNNKQPKLGARLIGLPGKVNVTKTKIADRLPIYRLAVSAFPNKRKPLEESDAPDQGTWRFEIDGRSFSSPTTFTFFPPQKTAHNSSQAECGRFFSVLRANALAVDRFDVTLEREALRADNRDILQTHRLVLDEAENRALILRKTRTRNLGAGDEKLSLECWLISEKQTYIRSAETTQKSLAIPFKHSLRTHGFYNLQLVGAVAFPLEIGSQSFGGADRWASLIQNANGYGKLEQNSRTAKMDIVLPPTDLGPGSTMSRRTLYSVDLRTLAPKSAEWGWLAKRDGTQLPFQPTQRELYRWTEIKGIVLPTTISSSQVSHRRVGDELRPENGFQETKLHWNSVNESLPEEWWMPERWADLDEIRKQCVYPKSE